MRRLLVLALLASGLACGDDGGRVSLTVQVAGEPEETAVYDLIAEAYMDRHPGIDVVVDAVASKGDHLAKLTTAFAGGDPPDLFLVNFREYSQFVTRDAVEAVGPRLEAAGIDVEQYYGVPVAAFTFAGELQCMPQNISSMVVYYNTDLFEAAGVDEPADDWEWDDFAAAAAALTDGEVRGLGIEPTIVRLAPFVWSNGGEVVDDTVAPGRFTLDSPEARQALEFIDGLVEDGAVPTEEEVAAEDLETRFTTGKLGMFLSSRRETPSFREVAGLNWDVAPPPVAGGGQPATILHADGFCLARDGVHLDEAMDFLAFAVGEQGQGIAALGGRTVPSLRSVAESPAFLDPTRPPSRAQVWLDQIPAIRQTPVIPTWPEIEDVAEQVFTRLFYEDGYTVDDAIADLEEGTADLFDEGTNG